VLDTARDESARIAAGEFLDMGSGVRVRGAVGVAFHGDGGHRYDRAFDIVIHSYRWRVGLTDGERKYDAFEKRLAT
jgi:hypothetical protein